MKLIACLIVAVLAQGCRTAGPQYIMRDCQGCTITAGESLTDANQGKVVSPTTDAKVSVVP